MQVLRTLEVELKTLEEQEQLEEFAVRALQSWTVRAFLRCLVMRALKQKHWVCVQASWA